MKSFLIIAAIAAIASPTFAAETRADALASVKVPADAVEFMRRVDAVTIHVCGADTRTLYFRSCSDDVSAFLKASISVKARRSFQSQRATNPHLFSQASFRLF